jgi:hypothetical protein
MQPAHPAKAAIVADNLSPANARKMISVARIPNPRPGLQPQATHSTISQCGKQCSAFINSPIWEAPARYTFLLLFERCLRNNRIGLEPFFYQHCALSDYFEPMLLARKGWSFSSKILVAIDGNDLACCDHQSQYDGKGSKI